MTDTMASLRRKITGAGDLQSVVRTMKAMAAGNISQYENSVRALADYYRTVQLGLRACLKEGALTSGTGSRLAARPSGMPRAIVFGSDQGLVGQFNEVVADFAIKALAAVPGQHRVWAVGERVHTRLEDAGLPLVGVFAVPNSVQAITSLVQELQISSEAHRERDRNVPLWVFHNRPVSGSLFEPVRQCLLPLDANWRKGLTD